MAEVPPPPSQQSDDDHHQIVSDDDEEVIDYSVKPELYDSEADDKDEGWVRRRRKGRASDAILSCPACFTTLSIDCQRHETIVTQYRAMFVMNCKVTQNQRLRLTAESKKQQKDRRRGKNRKHENNTFSVEENLQDEVFRPVCCSICNTEVAVLDEDEIYHFFNVLPSYG